VRWTRGRPHLRFQSPTPHAPRNSYWYCIPTVPVHNVTERPFTKSANFCLPLHSGRHPARCCTPRRRCARPLPSCCRCCCRRAAQTIARVQYTRCVLRHGFFARVSAWVGIAADRLLPASCNASQQGGPAGGSGALLCVALLACDCRRDRTWARSRSRALGAYSLQLDIPCARSCNASPE